MRSSHTDVDVLVVGGGIGGLASALSVARAGRLVHLIEQAPQFGEIGAGLQLGPNALRAFDRLGVYDEVARTAVVPERGVVRSALDGEVLTVLEFGPSFEKHYGYPYVVSHRRDVLDALLAACRAESGITLLNGRTAVEAVDQEDSATVTFEEGEPIRANLLIGADGIRSRIRRTLDPTEPRFTGHVALRGAVPIAEVGGQPDLREVTLWIGPGVHLIQYPVRGGEMYNRVAVFVVDPERPDELGVEEAFAHTTDEVREAVGRIDPALRWPIHDHDPLPCWTGRRTVLIGDAAHAMLQYLGQGACQALEDAVALGRAVAKSSGDLPVAIKAFEAERYPIATRCQQVARPWGELWHTSDPTVVALRDRVFAMRAPDDYSELDWLYADREHPAAECEESA